MPPSNKGNANQNNFEISLALSLNGKDHQSHIQKMLEEVWVIVLVGLCIDSFTEEISMSHPQKSKNKSIMWSRYTTLYKMDKGVDIIITDTWSG